MIKICISSQCSDFSSVKMKYSLHRSIFYLASKVHKDRKDCIIRHREESALYILYSLWFFKKKILPAFKISKFYGTHYFFSIVPLLPLPWPVLFVFIKRKVCLDSEEILNNFHTVNANLNIALDIWVVINSAIHLWFIHRNVPSETYCSCHQIDTPVLLFRIFRGYAGFFHISLICLHEIHPICFLDLYICLPSMAVERNFSSGKFQGWQYTTNYADFFFFYLCRICYRWPTAKQITEFIEEICSTL